jgi:hypothetical protein
MSSEITAEGGTITLSTAPDGEITASSADFAVYVVQQVEGGGSGVTEYDTVAELITASEGSLAVGYYEVVGIVLTYWDGTNFRDSNTGTIIDLSPIMDHLADVVFWFETDINRKLTTDGSAVGSSVSLWQSRHPKPPRAAQGTRTITTINGSPAVEFGDGTSMSSPYWADIVVDGPFEIFSTVELANNTDTNKGIAGTWNGVSVGWLLGSADAIAPNGVWFGFDGTWARDAVRLGIDPHVVHGRYTGADVIVSVDGVDRATAAKTGVGGANTTPLFVGKYTSVSTTVMEGKLGTLVMIKKLLTTQERADIVAHLMAGIGI